jgi:hypothetical protein
MYRGATDSNIKIVTSGLVMNIDASQLRSYSGSGTTWTDLSGNNNNGALTNGPTFSNANGGIITFDGINDYCAITNLVNLNNTSATHEIWVKLNAPNDGLQQQIFARTNTNAGTFNITKISGTNLFQMNYRNSANTQATVTLNTLPSTNWVHIVITYDGSVFNAYINGVLDTTTSAVTGALNTGGTFAMALAAQTTGATAFCPCNIGLARAYNRALSAIEVLQNFNVTRIRFNL